MRRLVFFAAVVLSIGSQSNAEYGPGFIWNRFLDHQDGTIHGSSEGNPIVDSMGNPVWSLESTNEAGDGLGGENPWYNGETDLAVWDNKWYSWNSGKWARGDNVSPVWESHAFNHEGKFSEWYSHVPIVRWLNPVDKPVCLDITGTLGISWWGPNPGVQPVDLVIAHVDASLATVSEVYAETFEKKTDAQTGDSVEDSIDIQDLWVEPGDELIISLRRQQWEANGHSSLHDKYITIEIQQSLPPGDANGDWMVNDLDAAILATYWQYEGMIEIGWEHGDFNGDGKVTDADAAILATHWQEGVEGSAPVPEPSTIALLSMAVVGLIAYTQPRRNRIL